MTNIRPYFKFRISIDGIKRITAELEDALYDANSMDALLSVTKGIVSLTYHRQATSMSRAIEEAEKQIESVTLIDGTRLRVRGLHIVSDL